MDKQQVLTRASHGQFPCVSWNPLSPLDTVLSRRSEKLNKCILLCRAHGTHHDLVQLHLSLMDPVSIPSELFTAPECYSVTPCLCTWCAFYQNILSQLLCSEDVLRLSYFSFQPRLNDPHLVCAYLCHNAHSAPFLIFSTLEWKHPKGRGWMFRSPPPSMLK